MDILVEVLWALISPYVAVGAIVGVALAFGLHALSPSLRFLAYGGAFAIPFLVGVHVSLATSRR